MKSIELDELDIKLLNLLQSDASLSNQELAAAAHTSAPTCLRRIKQLQAAGLIERISATLNPQAVAASVGHGLQAIVEITLEKQTAENLENFEKLMQTETAVQQCYRVSPGPDFVLVIYVTDIPAYHALTQRLFTHNSNIRNVKAFFSIKRSKFGAFIPL